MNSVNLIGNLTREPELRQTASGTSVLQFGIAVNDRIKQNGQWVDYANFFDCTAFGKDKLADYLHKGSRVGINGKLRYSSWKDKQTEQTRSRVEIMVDNIDLLSPKQEQKPKQVSQEVADIYGGQQNYVDDSEIPF